MIETFEAALQKVSLPSGQLGQVMRLALTGGHRWRPLLLLTTVQQAGGNIADATPVALAIELVHAASILLDDIDDKAKYRRSVLATHERFDYGLVVLGSHQLLVTAQQLAISERVRQRLLVAVSRMISAQAQELEYRGQALEEPKLLEIASGKTGELFSFSSWAAGMIAGVGDCEELRLLGLHAGLGYQLIDDLADTTEDKINRTPTVATTFGAKRARVLYREQRQLALWLSTGSAKELVQQILPEIPEPP